MEKGVNDLEDVFILLAYPKNAIPSPFGFTLAVRDHAQDVLGWGLSGDDGRDDKLYD